MRLIDADKLTELIATNVYPLCDAFNSRDYGMFWTGGIEKAINEMPTIDAVEKKVDVVRCNDCKKVEVVRCRECKHWKCNPNTEEWGKCKWISDEQFDVVMNGDDFCSYGERSE